MTTIKSNRELLRENEVLRSRLKKAEDVVMLARQLTAYSWEDRLEDCKVSDDAKHDSRELSTAIWLYDQEETASAEMALAECPDTEVNPEHEAAMAALTQ